MVKWESVSTEVTSDRTRANGLETFGEQQQGRFSFYVRKKFFMEGVP